MFLYDFAEFGRKVRLSPVVYGERSSETGRATSDKTRSYKRALKEGSVYPGNVRVDIENSYTGEGGLGRYYRNNTINRELEAPKGRYAKNRVRINTYGKKGSRTTDTDILKIDRKTGKIANREYSRQERYRAEKIQNPWDISTETPKKLNLTDTKIEQKQLKALPPAKSTPKQNTKTSTPTPVKSTPKSTTKKPSKFLNKYSLGALGAAGVLGGGYLGYRAYQNRKKEGKK